VVYANRAGGYELAGAYAILVIGYQFIFSYAGAASLAQSCFFGLGAYVTGVFGATYGLGTEITLPLSILAPGLLAAAVAGAVLRLEDHYFSLATLAITLLVTLVVTQSLSVTGGTNGLSGIPSFSLFGQTVASRYDTMRSSGRSWSRRRSWRCLSCAASTDGPFTLCGRAAPWRRRWGSIRRACAFRPSC
jgi:ABC-type branched-subunit amino acid transport system permease subunit